MLGSGNVFSEEDTDDEFGLMPYLSEDGSGNAYILNVSRYIGLNKNWKRKAMNRNWRMLFMLWKYCLQLKECRL